MDTQWNVVPEPAPCDDAGNNPPAPLNEICFRTLIEEGPGAVIVYRQDAILFANNSALELFGTSSFENLAAHRFIDLIHPDDRPHFLTQFLLPARDKKKFTCDIRCVRLDESTICLEAACAPVDFHGESAIEIFLRDITKRKEHAERIRQQTSVMEGINRILHAALKYETEEELGRECLEIAETITQSTVGFIGEIRNTGFEKIALVHADSALMKATIPHRQHGGGFNMHPLYGRVLSEGKGFFSNDAVQEADRVDMPHGHPVLASILGVPLNQKGRTIGMIGLANKPGGYTHVDQEFIEALAPAIVESFMRNRMAAQMQLLYAQTRRDADTKTDLLNEINHRVKNNLMTILGLIIAEKRHMPPVQLALTEHIWEKFESRIDGLLKVHQMLSDSQWTPMNISELAERICLGVLDSNDMEKKIGLSITPSPINVSPRQANNLALVFNELMTNSLKYAFGDTEQPEVTIAIRREGDEACIEFNDNGSGYPADVLDSGASQSGLKLVRQLIEDTLDGSVRLMNKRGSAAEMRISIEESTLTSSPV